MGTLIVALRAKDGLVLARDSRGTVGDPRGLTAIRDTEVKLFELSTLCGTGITGSSELAASFFDVFKPEIERQGLLYVDEIMQKAREVLKRSYDDWFSKFPVDKRPALMVTVCGYNKTGGGTLEPKTYLLQSPLDFAPQLFPSGNALTGVVQYAVYLMHRLYDPLMTSKQACRLAAYLITETATQDPKVGGPVQMLWISPAGLVWLTTGEVEKMIQVNREQSQRMKDFFTAYSGEDSSFDIAASSNASSSTP